MAIFTAIYMKGTVLQAQGTSLLTSETKRIIDDEEMSNKLIPDFAVGCKRVIPSGSRFLKALKQDNVDKVFTGVSSFTETGCIDDEGQHHQGDVVICATGFNTSYVPRYPIVADGRNLQDEWSSLITGYMGVGVSGFPNTFTMLGPFSPVSNGPTLIAVEAQADYICHFIDRYQTEPTLRSMTLKPAAANDFTAHVADVMEKLVWTDGCRNSHNNHVVGSRTPTTWPGSTLHYIEAMREPRGDDWDFAYAGNRFAFLGTGISQAEWDPTSDPAYYIRRSDDARHGSRLTRNLTIAKTGSLPPRALHRQPKLSEGKIDAVTDGRLSANTKAITAEVAATAAIATTVAPSHPVIKAPHVVTMSAAPVTPPEGKMIPELLLSSVLQVLTRGISRFMVLSRSSEAIPNNTLD